MERIHIYHTNDLHSHFEHWPKISRLIRERVTLHKEQGDEVFVFDIGDHVDRWHPYTEGTMGKGNISLLNEAGYTAGTIGNNEGITLPFDALDSLYADKNFDVVLANLYHENGTRPIWADPYKIYTTEKGTRVGVIGVTAFFSLFYKMLGWKLSDPFEELKKQIAEVKEKADIIILLSHLGIHEDERIAEVFPEVDVILGGHTHHILHEGREMGSTLLAAAGKYGNFAGHVILDVENRQIKNKKAILYPIEQVSREPWELFESEELLNKGKVLLAKEAAVLGEPLTADFFEDSDLPGILCEALREWCEADCAFLNAGLILGPLEGRVTKYDLLSVCPHPINPCTVSLRGNELKEVLRMTMDKDLPHIQVKGLGFRGTVMGKFVYDRIEIAEGGLDFFIAGKRMNPEALYTVAIPDMYTFGRFFPEIVRTKTKRFFLPELLRDILEWKLNRL